MSKVIKLTEADLVNLIKRVLTEETNEASSPAQQAAIAINMKKKGIKPKNETLYEDEYGSEKIQQELICKELQLVYLHNHQNELQLNHH